jgi:dsDNA-specific endonuclease/ATPase MutS2
MLVASGVVLLSMSACSKGDRDTISGEAKDAYKDASAKVSEGWEKLKSFTYEQRDSFVDEFNSKQEQAEAELSKLKAEYSESKASASRKAAMEDVKSSDVKFKEKLSAIGRASADTWDAARDDVIAAWDELQASIARARASG